MIACRISDGPWKNFDSLSYLRWVPFQRRKGTKDLRGLLPPHLCVSRIMGPGVRHLRTLSAGAEEYAPGPFPFSSGLFSLHHGRKFV